MSSYDKTFKVLLISDPEVDKSCLFPGYLTDIPQSDDQKTIGVEFIAKTLVIDKKKYKLQFWDLIGEERFRFLLPTYCLGANAAVLLYDVTRSQTLDNIGEWTNIVRQTSGDIPIMLVGIILKGKNERQVSAEEGENIANSRNLSGYIECNLKTGKNVEKVFEDLTRLMLAHKDCRPPQKRDEALPLNKDNLKENKTLEAEKQLLDTVGLRLEQEVNSLRNEKGVDSNVRLKFIGAKMSSPKAPFIPPLHPPLPSKSYRDQIINLLSKIKRFWDLTNSRIIAVALVQGKDTILYSTDNWDISADVGRVISSWSSLNALFIVISGIKYIVILCTSDILVAYSLKGNNHIFIAKEEDYTIILHVEPDSGSMGNLDRGPPRHPGSASEAALVDF